MSILRGTNVLAPVVPFDTTDSHASHEARYGRGGYRSVADIAERDAIPALRREAGMLVCVLTDGKVWKLSSDLTTWTEFAVSSDWATLSGKPSTFPPSSHTHTSSQITDFTSAVAAAAQPTTDASLLVSGTLSAARLPASVVLTSDSRLSDSRTPTTHQHAVSDVTGLQAALDGKQASGSYAAASHTHTAGQVSGLATVATSGSYTDLTNKPTIPDAVTSLPASSITGLATVATSGAYADLSGKPTLFSGSYADLTNTPASFTPAAHVHAAGDISSGTLDDARLSGSITRNANLRWAMQATASSIDWFPRGHGSIGNASLASGALALAFFTAPYSMTATTLTFGSGGTATASLTLCRFALFTVSETITDSVTSTLPVITLVARTASDTTIGSATNTMYSRSFSTAGGWPASYELVAGTRYAAGILVVGTTAGLWQAATTGSAALMRLPPMAAGVITGLSDMPSAATVANGNYMLYGRIS